jgi:hypothetical protein
MSGGSSKADKSAKQAAEIQAQSQREALDYLKQTEQLPQALREGALTGLGAEYGLDAAGNYGADGRSIIERAEASPFYQTAIQRGEEGVLRNASATGGLRSGSTSENLAAVNQNALMASYANQLSGLQGLAQLPSNANNIAATMSGVGQTLGQGIIGGANSAAAASQNNINNGFAAAGLAMQGYETFSDERLKSEIQLVGRQKGHNIYSWMWNEAANALGLFGRSFGVIAQEVEKTHPNAVSEKDGYKRVNYDAIGVSHGV